MAIGQAIGRFFETAKPYLIGAGGGIVAAAIVAFSMNWIYTAGNTEEQVTQAKVAALAQVCEAKAHTYWTEQKGMKVAKLEGWGNEQREKLSKKFAPVVPNDNPFHEEVVEKCGDLLRPA